MNEGLVFKVALIGVLGIGSQWLAWRFNLPAIVLMSVAGLLAGPVFGVLSPTLDFGAFLQPVIALAVAVILFEGGLSLNFRELRGIGRGVRQLVFIGVPVGWILNCLAAHYIVELSWPVAILFGGVLVVTGPTVIIPLLRQARLAQRPAAILKWEGIINDPIGALLAVLVFEYATFTGADLTFAGNAAWLTASAAMAGAIGYGGGRAMAWSFRRGWVPEFLKAPVILALVLACYEAANMIHEEAGLLSVTAMGITLANSRVHSIEEVRRFKENIAIILVSAVFVVLTATLSRDMLGGVDWRVAAFVAAILFVARPLTVWLSTIGTEMTWREKLLVGWIAPRGIVAVAICGFFGTALVNAGYPDGGQLIVLAFAIVFATVVAHGFSIGWLARRLGLATASRPGVLIVGASPWSVELARTLRELDVPVKLADRNWLHLRSARFGEIPIYYGEILSEATEHRLDLNPYGYLIAVSSNDDYNALVCTDFAPEFGRTNVFQLGIERGDEDDPHGVSFTLRGRTLFRSGRSYEDLMKLHEEGWNFQKTRLTDEYTFDDYTDGRPEGSEMLVVVRASGELVFSTQRERALAEPGDTVIGLSPPVTRTTKAKPDRPPRARPVAAGLNGKSMDSGRLP
ncbi:MAG: sodium:proton antiporter [Rhodospirillales bacterium]|nr:sodium:proton antiporter [Rhodospirillales bacterium]